MDQMHWRHAWYANLLGANIILFIVHRGSTLLTSTGHWPVWWPLPLQATSTLVRVREINGEFPQQGAEIFDATLVKEHSTGLNNADICEFVEWLVQAPKQEVGGRDKIREKLKYLKHVRLASWHVYCPDGPVAPEQSMLFNLGPRFISLSLTGTPETVMKLVHTVEVQALGIGLAGGGSLYGELRRDPN